MTIKTILLLNDTTDHDNWGSVAGAEALKAIISEAVPDCRIKSVPSAWTTRRFKVLPRYLGGAVYSGRHSFLDRFSHPFNFVPAVADDFEQVADDWLKGKGGDASKSVLKKIESSDVVVFHGEGSTYRMNRSAVRCLFVLWLARKRFGKPSVFLNGSVTLTQVDPVLPAIVARAFRVLDGVAVREPRSLDNLRNWVPDVYAEVVPDSVFYWVPAETPQLSERIKTVLDGVGEKRYFCFSLSMLLSMIPGYMRWGASSSPLAHLLSSLHELDLVPVLLARDGMDQAIVRELVDCIGGVFVGPTYQYRDIQTLFSRAEFVISGRYHHLILATTVGCPGIAFRTTSHKVDGLCDLFNGDLGTVFDPTYLRSCSDSIIDRASEILSDTTLRKRIRKRAEDFKKQTERLGELVRNAMDGA